MIARAGTVVIVGLLLLGAAACQHSVQGQRISRITTAPASASPASAAPTLDSIFQSPSHLYSIRYNHTWQVAQLPNPSGTIDYFTLPNATLNIVTGSVQPGTTLESYVQQTEASYQKLNLKGLQLGGSIDVGGGQGEVLRAVTYVTASGATVAAPPSSDAPPHLLYQALYIAGGHSFAFSIAWPQSDSTDYIALFRSMLQTFTLAGAS